MPLVASGHGLLDRVQRGEKLLKDAARHLGLVLARHARGVEMTIAFELPASSGLVSMSQTMLS